MGDILSGEIDCHAHAYDGADGYPTLVEIAETYGILIRSSDGLPGWEQWADWYTVTGPRDQLVRFLGAEYCGDEVLAAEMVDGFAVAP